MSTTFLGSTSMVLIDAVVFSSYDPTTYRSLIQSLSDGQAGDGRLLGLLSDAYREFEGWDVYTAVSCIDSSVPDTAAEFAAFAGELEAASPLIGEAIANELLPCAYWPAAPVSEAGPISAPNTGPLLVIGNTGDVATPYVSAVAVTDVLADAVLLTYDGEGHTSLGRSDCVDDAVSRYLIDLELPAEGTRCP